MIFIRSSSEILLRPSKILTRWSGSFSKHCSTFKHIGANFQTVVTQAPQRISMFFEIDFSTVIVTKFFSLGREAAIFSAATEKPSSSSDWQCDTNFHLISWKSAIFKDVGLKSQLIVSFWSWLDSLVLHFISILKPLHPNLFYCNHLNQS